MFTGDIGSYHFMGMKISFPYTAESHVQDQDTPKACLLDISLTYCCYVQARCLCLCQGMLVAGKLSVE